MPTRPRRILLIDDDIELCQLIEQYLLERGYEVEAVHDGREGLRRALSITCHLIILDGMLPTLDGLEVLAQLRRRSNVPVIMLTARTSRQDKIAGLEAGADDYLPKPFDPGELLARIGAVLRRTGQPAARRTAAIEVSGVLVNAATRQASCRGRPLLLTSAEFDILELLVRSAGRVVSRDEISAVCHQRESSPFDRAIDVHVSHLRKKLDAGGTNPIRTIRGAGYLFAPE